MTILEIIWTSGTFIGLISFCIQLWTTFKVRKVSDDVNVVHDQIDDVHEQIEEIKKKKNYLKKIG